MTLARASGTERAGMSGIPFGPVGQAADGYGHNAASKAQLGASFSRRSNWLTAAQLAREATSAITARSLGSAMF